QPSVPSQTRGVGDVCSVCSLNLACQPTSASRPARWSERAASNFVGYHRKSSRTRQLGDGKWSAAIRAYDTAVPPTRAMTNVAANANCATRLMELPRLLKAEIQKRAVRPRGQEKQRTEQQAGVTGELGARPA